LLQPNSALMSVKNNNIILLKKLMNNKILLKYYFLTGVNVLFTDAGWSNIENARGSPRSVFLVFSQSYIKYNLRKNKIIVASTTDFFKH
jgi:hypothetical protein